MIQITIPIAGTVKIAVANTTTAGTITYTTDSDSAVEFDDEDFNDVCNDLTDENLSYVKFTLPSTTYGKLYYDYTSSSDYGSVVFVKHKNITGILSSPYLVLCELCAQIKLQWVR